METRVCYRSVPSPIGELYLAATAAGLCRLSWYSSEVAFVTELEQCWDRVARWGVTASDEEVVRSAAGSAVGLPPVLDEAARQLAGYFAGQRREFEFPLDLTRMRSFPRQVLTALLQIPYGEVVSYGELAVLAGYPGAARAVGGVMRGNPLPIVVPCHRVVLGSGALGGFGGRPDLKRRLLELEGWSEARGGCQPKLENLFE